MVILKILSKSKIIDCQSFHDDLIKKKKLNFSFCKILDSIFKDSGNDLLDNVKCFVDESKFTIYDFILFMMDHLFCFNSCP